MVSQVWVRMSVDLSPAFFCRGVLMPNNALRRRNLSLLSQVAIATPAAKRKWGLTKLGACPLDVPVPVGTYIVIPLSVSEDILIDPVFCVIGNDAVAAFVFPRHCCVLPSIVVGFMALWRPNWFRR